MKSDPVIVKDSEISGKGIFATKNFKKGDVVLHWDTKHKLSKEEANRLSENDKHFLIHVKEEYLLVQPPERFINHSCDPNTKVKDFSDVAVREINVGEEITSDYSDDLPEGFVMTCFCKAKNCRKIITRKP